MLHVKADMRRASMKRTRLRKRANKTGKEGDLKRYKQQRNLIVSRQRKAKRDFYNSAYVNIIDNVGKFRKAVKPMSSNGNPLGEKSFLLKMTLLLLCQMIN